MTGALHCTARDAPLQVAVRRDLHEEMAEQPYQPNALYRAMIDAGSQHQQESGRLPKCKQEWLNIFPPLATLQRFLLFRVVSPNACFNFWLILSTFTHLISFVFAVHS